MEAIRFTEDELLSQVNRHAPLDGRAMPRLGKGGEHRTGKCTRCGKPSYPYALCRHHRELGSIKRVVDGAVEDGLVERVTDGRGRKGGAFYKLSEKGRLAIIKKPFVREVAKIGRNDPCPCDSGKKYKHCCGTTKSA